MENQLNGDFSGKRGARAISRRKVMAVGVSVAGVLAAAQTAFSGVAAHAMHSKGRRFAAVTGRGAQCSALHAGIATELSRFNACEETSATEQAFALRMTACPHCRTRIGASLV